MTVVKAGNVRESESTRIDVKEEGVSAERDAKVRKEHSQVVSSSLGHIRDKGDTLRTVMQLMHFTVTKGW